jgi:hypothetical protein
LTPSFFRFEMADTAIYRGNERREA